MERVRVLSLAWVGSRDSRAAAWSRASWIKSPKEDSRFMQERKSGYWGCSLVGRLRALRRTRWVSSVMVCASEDTSAWNAGDSVVVSGAPSEEMMLWRVSRMVFWLLMISPAVHFSNTVMSELMGSKKLRNASPSARLEASSFALENAESPPITLVMVGWIWLPACSTEEWLSSELCRMVSARGSPRP